MSVLAGKNILIVGDENQQIVELENALKLQQMRVFTVSCTETTISDLTRKNIDVILLNHLHDGDPCNVFLTELRNTRFIKKIPIFALIDDTAEKIEHVLMLGAADYITATENTASVIKKIKVMLGESDNLSSSSLLEVPLDIPQISVKGRRVFVVEDDSLLRNLLAAKLSMSSLPYEFAASGGDALDKIKNFKPNIIILDLMLPIHDGFEVLTELRADAALKSIPVVVFSNKDSEEDKKRAFSLGADRYYVKAMTDLSTLISAIEELT